jgi:hypothetical protein
MVRHGLPLQMSQFHPGRIHVQMETIIDALMQRYRQSSKKLRNGLVHG